MSDTPKPSFGVKPMTELEKLAMERVRKAGVKAPESAILDFIRCGGAESILAAKLCDPVLFTSSFLHCSCLFR